MPDPSDWPLELSDEPPLTPGSAAELSDIVRQASVKGTALFPLGGQTQIGLGLPPERKGTCINLLQVDRVIDYPARDMTITVQAGITLDKLRQVLASENQWLPVDVPQGDRATLGGSLAVNVSGPRRLGFGTFRDYVLGVSFVNDQGQEVKAGGRVVKNVAGYDICKLVIGSLGTFGILTQVTLKVKPRPEQKALVTIACDGPDLDALLERLHGSKARPVCVELLNGRTAAAINRDIANILPTSAWVVVVGFEDNREAAPWGAQQLIKEFPPGLSRSWDVRVGTATDWLWKALTEFSARGERRLTFKANLRPRDVASFCHLAEEKGEGLLIQAHAGSGIVLGHASDDLTRERAAAMLQVLTDAAVKSAGNVILTRCPTEWKATLPVWGLPRPDLGLMRRVKEKLDPKRLFNPGRFIHGI